MVDVWGGIPKNYQCQIITGDQAELAKALPDECIDLIFTDPPYPREFLQTFYDMGAYAGRVLKPGGSLITLCGHWQVPQVIEAMQIGGLDYHWCGWLLHNGPKRSLPGYRVVCGGKPLLWFTNGKGRPALQHGFWWDTVLGDSREKSHHEWQQSESWARKQIPILCPPDGIVLEPFCGGGTVPVVCNQLGRRWVSFELNPETAAIARQRVANSQLVIPELVAQDNF